MPELPEVETTTRGLRKTIKGLVIKNTWTDWRNFKIPRKEISNAKVTSVERRGKNILINLSNQKTILVHMKMTGHLLYEGYKKDPFNRFIHFTLTFHNGKKLYFSDMRKFGKITLLDTKIAHDTKHLNNIGPEPLDPEFKLENFIQRLNLCKNKKIKTTLMDQSIVAGIGNIYSDEILWRAGIHPERKISKLKEKEIKLIFKALKETLAKGINFGGDSMSDYRNIRGLPGKFQLHHEAYRRTGEKCRKLGCSGVIKRKVINGRSAHFCNMHQK